LVPHYEKRLAAWYAENLQACPSVAVALGVDHGLLHGLKHLCLHSQHLFKSRQRGWHQIGVLVVVLPIVLSVVGDDTVPCAGHLMYEH
jgi:hypothetical protein